MNWWPVLETIYTERGASAVREFCSLFDLPEAYCKGCETEQPVYDGACAVCGSKMEEK